MRAPEMTSSWCLYREHISHLVLVFLLLTLNMFADTKAVARKKPYKKHTDHIPSYKIKTFTYCTALLYFFEKKSNKNHKYNCCLLFPVHFHSKEIFPEFRGASSRLNFPDRKLISCGFYAVFPVDYTSWRKANPMKFPKYNPSEN